MDRAVLVGRVFRHAEVKKGARTFSGLSQNVPGPGRRGFILDNFPDAALTFAGFLGFPTRGEFAGICLGESKRLQLILRGQSQARQGQHGNYRSPAHGTVLLGAPENFVSLQSPCNGAHPADERIKDLLDLIDTNLRPFLIGLARHAEVNLARLGIKTGCLRILGGGYLFQ